MAIGCFSSPPRPLKRIGNKAVRIPSSRVGMQGWPSCWRPILGEVASLSQNSKRPSGLGNSSSFLWNQDFEILLVVSSPNPHQGIRKRLLENFSVAMACRKAEHKTLMVALIL